MLSTLKVRALSSWQDADRHLHPGVHEQLPGQLGALVGGRPVLRGVGADSFSITGNRASAISRFTLPTRSFRRARSISLRFR